MTGLAVLAAGDGLGFQAVHDACLSGELAAAVVVLAAEKKCAAIIRAETARVPIVFHPWGPYKVAGKLRETYDRDLAARLWMQGTDLVLLDGWERELTWGFEEMYTGRIIDLGSAGTPPLESESRDRILDRVRAALAGFSK